MSTIAPFIHASLTDRATRITDHLEERGIAFIEGITSDTEAIAIARSIGEIVPHRDSEASGLTRIVHRPEIAGARGYLGFSSEALFPHTDRSSLPSPPGLLMQVCWQRAGTGGAATLADGRRILASLSGNFPELLSHLRAPAAAIFSDGVSHRMSPIFEELEDGSTAVRFRFDSGIFFSGPLSSRVHELLSVVRSHVVTLDLRPGQAYIVNNRWWLHGRQAFQGSREMWRLLVQPVRGSAIKARLREGFVVADELAVAA
jgi:alpha-ketoglutarate-dependent taurine dioxygenase